MSVAMDEETKRWTTRRKPAFVLEIIRGKTTVADAGGDFMSRCPLHFPAA